MKLPFKYIFLIRFLCFFPRFNQTVLCFTIIYFTLQSLPFLLELCDFSIPSIFFSFLLFK